MKNFRETSSAGSESLHEKQPVNLETLLEFDFPWVPLENSYRGREGLSFKDFAPFGLRDDCDLGYVGRLNYAGKIFEVAAQRMSVESFVGPNLFEHEPGVMRTLFAISLGLSAEINTIYYGQIQKRREVVPVFNACLQIETPTQGAETPTEDGRSIDYVLGENIIRGRQFLGPRNPDISDDFKGLSPRFLEALLKEVERFTSRIPKVFRHKVKNYNIRPNLKGEMVNVPKDKWERLYGDILKQHGYTKIHKTKEEFWQKDYAPPSETS